MEDLSARITGDLQRSLRESLYGSLYESLYENQRFDEKTVAMIVVKVVMIEEMTVVPAMITPRVHENSILDARNLLSCRMNVILSPNWRKSMLQAAPG
jgi:hypothetical protein